MSDKVSYVTHKVRVAVRIQLIMSRIPLLIILIGVFLQACSSTEPSLAPVPTRLVLGLDGVAYDTFKRLQDGGHFRNFTPVSPMVSSFPSISDPNWTQIFNLPPGPSFTKAYFDPTVKTARGFGVENGGLMTHLSAQPLYEKVMNFRLEGMWEHLTMFIWTETTALYWLESLERDFFNFRGKDTYFSLFINPDIISHTDGEAALIKYLSVIEDRIEIIQKRYKVLYGTDLEVILISDHGNVFLKPKDIPFESQLEDAGWKIASTITSPHDVGFYVPEMLGFGAFYAEPSMIRDLTMSLSGVTDIQSAMYQDKDDQIHVISKKSSNESLITYDKIHDRLTYKVIKGQDPIDQIKYFKKGYLSSRDYFQKSLDDQMPNAVMRIWEGFNINSQIKPGVLANATLGHVFGNKALRLVTDIRGFASTHGSLSREETLGIFTSTKTQVPSIRPQDFQNYVNVKPLLYK